jgi:hypothetical protein
MQEADELETIRSLIIHTCSTVLQEQLPAHTTHREMEHLLCRCASVAALEPTEARALEYTGWLVKVVTSSSFKLSLDSPQAFKVCRFSALFGSLLCSVHCSVRFSALFGSLLWSVHCSVRFSALFGSLLCSVHCSVRFSALFGSLLWSVLVLVVAGDRAREGGSRGDATYR